MSHAAAGLAEVNLLGTRKAPLAPLVPCLSANAESLVLGIFIGDRRKRPTVLDHNTS